jgi:mRNA interferase RelE/StbE
MATYTVRLKKSAEKELDSLPASVQARILAALEALANNPRPDGCQKLKGSENTYRVRVGDYRIIYEIHDGQLLIYVLRIADRKDAY